MYSVSRFLTPPIHELFGGTGWLYTFKEHGTVLRNFVQFFFELQMALIGDIKGESCISDYRQKLSFPEGKFVHGVNEKCKLKTGKCFT